MVLLLENYSQIVDEQDRTGRTPIYLAAKYNNLDVLQILIQRLKIFFKFALFKVRCSRHKLFQLEH